MSRKESSAARSMIFGTAVIGALGTLSLHILLPALPDIGHDFSSNVGTVQLLISLAILATALGNLLVAPLSDRWGRRRILMLALSLYIAGSLLGFLAPSLAVLVPARVLQAFGGGAAIAVARAWVMDYFADDVSSGGAARALAYSGMTVLVIPMIAPTIGGLAVQFWKWRSVFLIAAVLGALVLWFTRRRSPAIAAPTAERATVPRPVRKAKGSLDAYRQLLDTPEYVAQVALGASMMCVAYTFIAGAPYVAIQLMHVSPAQYGLLYIIPAIGSFTGFTVAGRLSHRVGPLDIMKFSVRVLCISELVFAGLMVAGLLTPLAMFIPGMCLMFANALAIPSVTSRALAIRPDIAGAASGFIGFAQLATSAVASQIVGSAANQTPFPLIITMAVGCAAAVISYWRLGRIRARATGA